ncbi:hypothetical protein RSAG8_12912, partial [Rhizoctonia solani AG-8 WAC10335]
MSHVKIAVLELVACITLIVSAKNTPRHLPNPAHQFTSIPSHFFPISPHLYLFLRTPEYFGPTAWAPAVRQVQGGERVVVPVLVRLFESGPGYGVIALAGASLHA